jgi:DNA-binding PadR family transcriptional regulator
MGAHGFGPRGGPFGRGRARRGEVRTAILQLLNEEPRNGYQIISELAERSGGSWRPSPGAVYPALNQLEDEGLVESFDNDGSRAFRLTNAGREAPEVHSDTARVWADWTASGEPQADVRSLWREFSELGLALKAAMMSADADTVAKATALIAETKRGLYGLLATPPASAGSDPAE